ncbi:CRISPR-associated protein [Lachnospiraceae bacterium AM48-27BH]|nr:CRISPR-associated protein [Lachnospiraceae bacterium AM48-27BH]
MSNILSNRYEFMFLVEASGCNPNGDPDMGNLPRQDEDTELGYITDVALKRRIRNYIQDAYGTDETMQILMQKGTSINEKIAESALAVNEITAFPKNFVNTKVSEAEDYMTNRYWDVRTFGGVLSTGRNAGQVRGAVQLTGCNFSIDPIQPKSITVTRMCYTDGGDYSTLEGYKRRIRSFQMIRSARWVQSSSFHMDCIWYVVLQVRVWQRKMVSQKMI